MAQFDKMLNFLTQAWHLKSEIVPCLVGPVGIGKTAAVRQHAKNVNADVVTIIASQILPSEVSGLTMPDAETQSMAIYDHYKLSHLKDGDILFFDELLEADPQVLSACLTLIESRLLMSGTKLPDIQIIAATNPTVQPGQLKANVRQRFMFMTFELDKNSVQNHIEKLFNIHVSTKIINNLQTDSKYDFNILTPRTLTKLYSWMDATPMDDRKEVARLINNLFNSDLGDNIYADFKNPKNQIIDTIIEVNPEYKERKEEFSTSSLEELMETLQELPDWEDIKQKLSTVNISE